MAKLKGFDYKKAEADLDDAGALHPDEVYSYHSEKAVRGYMKEHGLNPDKSYKPDDKNASSGSEESDSGGCYLTTACVAARGLPDTCAELQMLRAFRDGVLAHRPGGQQEIERYCQMAPGIVAAINQRKDAAQIWNRVYEELVEPCVQMIHEGKDEEAYRLYRAHTLSLSDETLFATVKRASRIKE